MASWLNLSIANITHNTVYKQPASSPSSCVCVCVWVNSSLLVSLVPCPHLSTWHGRQAHYTCVCSGGPCEGGVSCMLPKKKRKKNIKSSCEHRTRHSTLTQSRIKYGARTSSGLSAGIKLFPWLTSLLISDPGQREKETAKGKEVEPAFLLVLNATSTWAHRSELSRYPDFVTSTMQRALWQSNRRGSISDFWSKHNPSSCSIRSGNSHHSTSVSVCLFRFFPSFCLYLFFYLIFFLCDETGPIRFCSVMFN